MLLLDGPLFYAPFKEDSFAAVRPSVGWSVLQQFPLISPQRLHILKRNLSLEYLQVKFDLTELCPFELNLQFPFIFFPEVTHTEKIIQVKFGFGYDRTIFDRILPHGLKFLFFFFAVSFHFLRRGLKERGINKCFTNISCLCIKVRIFRLLIFLKIIKLIVFLYNDCFMISA